MEEETRNQEVELNNGVGALELYYRPGGQMSESSPDTSHKPHLKSGMYSQFKENVNWREGE